MELLHLNRQEVKEFNNLTIRQESESVPLGVQADER